MYRRSLAGTYPVSIPTLGGQSIQTNVEVPVDEMARDATHVFWEETWRTHVPFIVAGLMLLTITSVVAANWLVPPRK